MVIPYIEFSIERLSITEPLPYEDCELNAVVAHCSLYRETAHDVSPCTIIRPSTIFCAFGNLTTVHGAIINSSVTLTV